MYAATTSLNSTPIYANLNENGAGTAPTIRISVPINIPNKLETNPNCPSCSTFSPNEDDLTEFQMITYSQYQTYYLIWCFKNQYCQGSRIEYYDRTKLSSSEWANLKTEDIQFIISYFETELTKRKRELKIKNLLNLHQL